LPLLPTLEGLGDILPERPGGYAGASADGRAEDRTPSDGAEGGTASGADRAPAQHPLLLGRQAGAPGGGQHDQDQGEG